VGPSFGSSGEAFLPQYAKISAPLTKQDFSVPTIGIDSMDEEHERCNKALAAMMKRPTISSVRNVLEELQHHFAHEEGLLVLHGFGGKPDNPFSAIHSHTKDHKRIIEMVESAISAGEECGAAASDDAAPGG
jgi:hemerythrin